MRSSALVNEIARERMDRLFQLAKEQELAGGGALARRYVRLIIEIAAHYKVGLPKDVRENVCKRCCSVLIPGKNAGARIASTNRHVIYTCALCGTEKHVHY